MKTPVILKYGFVACLFLWLLANSRLLYAQDKEDSVEVTNFSANADTLIILQPDTLKQGGKDIRKQKTAMDTLSAVLSNASKRIDWDSLRQKHSPRRAALYSAVFPGLGQIYNRQYVKVPLMMGGIGIATGVFIFNFDHYTTFRDAYRLRLNGKMTGDPRVDIYNESGLKYIRDGYRKYVDYSVLGFAAVYLYNIIDAVVFGYLYDFDVTSPLTKVNLKPVYYQETAYMGGSYVGLSLTYHF